MLMRTNTHPMTGYCLKYKAADGVFFAAFQILAPIAHEWCAVAAAYKHSREISPGGIPRSDKT
jgi:hypothetical protein